MGNRFKGEMRHFDYGIEWAIQIGSRAHEDILAWAWYSGVGYEFALLPWKLHINFEYNHASGDSDAQDGNYETFDDLYPVSYVYYWAMVRWIGFAS